ncbi:MAG: bifunctional phosphopantothenoylcysteine decarboxylase/phosphopantothenate--cysteine ligase CoaBC [Nitriliruptoraceae bacterium]
MARFASARILVGVSGGIGAYKAALLARALIADGATVDVALTRGAQSFIGAATFAGITSRPVHTDVFDDIADGTHVDLGRQADAAIVYPATAHTIARLAHGFADDLLTTTLLAFRGPLIIAPAMHTDMWMHPATQANVQLLSDRGAIVVGPDDGPLMGGDVGAGRLVEPAAILDALAASGARAHGADFDGRTVVVTAGGTREPIDPVRFLGNRSSGRMGFALAAAAQQRGAQVILIAAPTHLPTPHGVRRVDITTAHEMRDAVRAHIGDTDVVIKAAAVADFRPAEAAPRKVKKDQGAPTLELVANPDILAELGRDRGSAKHPVLVGFAAETDEVRSHAERKIAAKGADLLVVNDVTKAIAGFEVDTNDVSVLDAAGTWHEIPPGMKIDVAHAVLDLVIARIDDPHSD